MIRRFLFFLFSLPLFSGWAISYRCASALQFMARAKPRFESEAQKKGLTGARKDEWVERQVMMDFLQADAKEAADVMERGLGRHLSNLWGAYRIRKDNDEQLALHELPALFLAQQENLKAKRVYLDLSYQPWIGSQTRLLQNPQSLYLLVRLMRYRYQTAEYRRVFWEQLTGKIPLGRKINEALPEEFNSANALALKRVGQYGDDFDQSVSSQAFAERQRAGLSKTLTEARAILQSTRTPATLAEEIQKTTDFLDFVLKSKAPIHLGQIRYLESLIELHQAWISGG